MQPINGEVMRPRRKSAFKETGLFEEDTQVLTPSGQNKSGRKVRFRSNNDIFEHVPQGEDDSEEAYDSASVSWPSTTVATTNLTMKLMDTTASRSPHRLPLIAFVLIISTLIAQLVPLGKSRMLVVEANSVPVRRYGDSRSPTALAKRADDPTNYCKKWSQQSAIVNGTLYLYGGRKTTSASQTSNTWNNDFLTIDLTKSWQISTPSMSGLAQPSGPPAVANGYIWNSFDSLYLYGGEFSDNPQGTPTANSLWEYAIGSQDWIEHTNPQTSAGTNSESSGEPIQRAAEGAGFSLATLGRGWYFGGHIDFLTTQDWSIQTPRVYLKSFVEYTFPGAANPQLTAKTGGTDGAWRNITSAGIQTQAGFTQRADGLLLYVPGFGAEGILLSLAGGTNDTFTQMNEVDIYDIAGSTWYRQATSGSTPSIRVNPCAVVAAAADGSSYNVYMFGGQGLLPYGNQTQYDDMWVLSLPTFAWIKVDQGSQSVPYGRSGHTCDIWDGQMVMVGGYTGTNNALTCESPGIYVYDMSNLEWVNKFTSISVGSGNPFSQQSAQKGIGSQAGLDGSYGYQVPVAVRSVIGGDGNGGATVTTPIQTATAGPMASGKPITYTLGQNTTTAGSSNNIGSHSNRSSVIGAIVAGVVAFLLLIAVVYLAVCAYIYRKQLALYREHLAMMQEQQSEKDNHSFYAANVGTESPTWQRRQGHESLIGPYHHPSESINTSGEASSHAVDASPNGSVEDLMEGMQPTFWGWNGVVLHPRRSLRIVNRDDARAATRDGE